MNNILYGRILFLMLTLSTTLQADVFTDGWNAVKTIAYQTGDAFVAAGKAIGDRFKDTKLTRSIDYGARKAAFEVSLAAAQGVLTAAQQASSQTLVAAEKTAELGLQAAEGFLRDVVGKASPEILQGAATAAKGVLEGAKASSVATLQGTEWVVNQTLGQFDLNRIRYEGDLRGLEHGILGKVLCEGKLLGKDFSTTISLNPREIAQSVEPLVNQAVAELKKQVIEPMQRDLGLVKASSGKVNSIDAILAKMDRPAQIDAGINAAKSAEAALQSIEKQQQLALNNMIKEGKKLNEVAMMSGKELQKLIQTQGKTSGYSGVAARQELARRLQQK